MSSYDAHNKALWLEGIAQVDEDTAYASCSEFNALYKVDLNTGDCTYFGFFPEEDIDGKRLFVKALYINERVYFIPGAASAICVFNPKDNSFGRIVIEESIEDVRYKNKYKFADAFVYKDYICILPATYPAIVKLNYLKTEVEYYSKNMPTGDYFFRLGAVQIENRLFVSNTKDNLVLEFNIESNEIKHHHVGENNNGSWSLVRDENYLWLIPKRQGAFVKWNYINGDVYEYNQYPTDYIESDFCFTKGYKRDSDIYVLPAKANMILKINKAGKIEKGKDFALKTNDIVTYMFDLEGFSYFNVRNADDVENKREFFRMKIDSGTVEKWNFIFKYEIDRYVKDYFLNRSDRLQENFKYKENEISNLSLYLDILLSGLMQNGKTTDAQNFIGEKIYQRIL